jgi:NADPH-dependent 2,4-dienoyl-CoA reductase/sulfur reductase-like enzyme
MSKVRDVAVIGGGPAGMAAAVEAAQLGLDVVLFDEHVTPGGAIYCAIGHSPISDVEILGSDFLKGRQIYDALLSSAVDYQPNTSIWSVDGKGVVGILREGTARLVTARRVILATGSVERSFPFPGWTLPGVMTAGAGQMLLKRSAMVPNDGVVLAGTGPLLLLVAVQYLRAGVNIASLIDMTPSGALTRAMAHLPGALRVPSYLAKGMEMLLALRRARVPVIRNARRLRAQGSDRLEAVVVESEGKDICIPATTLMVHFGLIPDTVFTRLIRLDHLWDDLQECWRPKTDIWGSTSFPTIALAGDCAGIYGAAAAEFAGRLAALETAHALGRISTEERDRKAAPHRRQYLRHRAVRPFLDAYFRPPNWLAEASDDTLLCRCEDVSIAAVREAVLQGCHNPNQVKAVTRCGMGPCQGRQCGLPLIQTVASLTNREPREVLPHRARPPLKPVTLGQMAALEL